uniref:Tetratricopeptide repeat (TPR)-like superfamily protein n=2 Tax=Zea mays TaxID=4577 RepID=A0A804QLM5_MAIZE
MGFQVAAVAPSPCARSSSASTSPSTSSRPLPAFLGGGGRGCAGLARSRSPVYWGTGVMVRPPPPARTPARCALSASLDGMGGGDAEFMKRIEELAAAAGLQLQPAGAVGCGWPASVERSASNVGLPLSLRMMKRKRQQQLVAAARHPRWDEGLLVSAAGESVGRAFSSMVLIVRELQSFALQQIRDAVVCDDLQGVLARVQGEMHASFVWLFQHIFAGTPALMLSLMLLLANFTVQSMGHSVAAAAATIPPTPPAERAEPSRSRSRFDAASVKAFSVGRTASVSGNDGGGGKTPPVSGATGDGRSDESSLYRPSRVTPQQPSAPPGAETAAQYAANAAEEAIWEMMLAEASKMQASARAEELSDSDVLRGLVAPVETELETEDHAEHTLTQQRYEQAVAAAPNNSLILANFAQFLYLVQNDHDRAEHYFERAVRAEPADSEALSWYATFLWKARNDLAGAEETYQEAIAADPGNAHHAAAYAHFLWNTGGDDTCYPLD